MSRLQQPGSPGGISDVSTPTKKLMSGMLSLSPFKRTAGSGGGGSPFGSEGGASPAAASVSPQHRSLIPSYGHAVQKREIIRQQEEQLAGLRLQLQQQGVELARWAAASQHVRPVACFSVTAAHRKHAHIIYHDALQFMRARTQAGRHAQACLQLFVHAPCVCVHELHMRRPLHTVGMQILTCVQTSC